MLEGSTIAEKEDYEYTIPNTLQNIQESICNYIAVQQQLYPTDVTPVTVLRLMIRYKWLVQATDMNLKKIVIQDYFSNCSKQNATRATNGLPTLSFSEHEDALKDSMIRNGLNPSPPVAIARLGQGSGSNRGARRGGGAPRETRGGYSAKIKSESSSHNRGPPLFQGSQLCYGFNSFDRECKNSPVSGGCKDNSGKFFHHVCSKFVAEKNSHCFARHRRRDHKQ